jgi:hypothetical protein
MSAAADLRRRVLGWQAAQRREQDVRAREGAPAPDAAFAAAADLFDRWAATNPPADALRDRDVAAVRASWSLIRQRMS